MRPRLAALLGALCIAFSGVFYRLSAVDPSTGTVFRALYGLPLLAGVAWLEHRRYGGLPRRTVALSIVAGLFFTADLTFWHHAIEAVGAGLATVLGNLQVLVVGIVAWIVFGERPARSVVVAVPIVLTGVVLISGVVGGEPYGRDPAMGVVLGVLTALAYGGYLLVMRVGARDRARPVSPVAISTLAVALTAAAIGVPLGDLDLAPSWPAHAWLFAYGLTSQSLGYVLIGMSLPRLPAVLVSIILLAQPVASVVLAMLILGESPSLAQLAGVAFVVGGIAVATIPVGALRDRRARLAR